LASHPHGDHAKIIKAAAGQFKEILDGSEQSVYLYLDDVNKVCNLKFAKLLGYRTAKEWSDVDKNFPDAFVSKKSRQTLVSAYQNAITRLVGSRVLMTWKRKDGKEVDTAVIIVPVVIDGHGMAIHFIEEA